CWLFNCVYCWIFYIFAGVLAQKVYEETFQREKRERDCYAFIISTLVGVFPFSFQYI
ncbi:unnamed protein product, partial [Prunus brigantina]